MSDEGITSQPPITTSQEELPLPSIASRDLQRHTFFAEHGRLLIVLAIVLAGLGGWLLASRTRAPEPTVKEVIREVVVREVEKPAPARPPADPPRAAPKDRPAPRRDELMTWLYGRAEGIVKQVKAENNSSDALDMSQWQPDGWVDYLKAFRDKFPGLDFKKHYWKLQYALDLAAADHGLGAFSVEDSEARCSRLRMPATVWQVAGDEMGVRVYELKKQLVVGMSQRQAGTVIGTKSDKLELYLAKDFVPDFSRYSSEDGGTFVCRYFAIDGHGAAAVRYRINLLFINFKLADSYYRWADSGQQ
jgi:hypothetical protein